MNRNPSATRDNAHTGLMSAFNTQADLPSWHGQGCRCAMHGRRLFTGGLLGAVAMGGGLASTAAQAKKLSKEIDPTVACLDYDKVSSFAKFVSAEQVEGGAQQQYAQMLQQAQAQRALGPIDHPQVKRLRAIADRIVPFANQCNPRAGQWKWEVNLLGSPQVNAFCMPGGKIAFYYGILSKLQLSDDEVAAIMGHEIAHALREHAREQIGKGMATRVGASVLGAVLGAGGLGDLAANIGGQLLSLKFGRSDETEADIVGMELAARAGYNPGAGVTLWQKMVAINKNAPPQWMSTHPAGGTRIKDIQSKLPRFTPLFERAPKPTQRFAPPPATVASGASAAPGASPSR
jgi:predicted Zn-dependent protease